MKSLCPGCACFFCCVLLCRALLCSVLACSVLFCSVCNMRLEHQVCGGQVSTSKDDVADDFSNKNTLVVASDRRSQPQSGSSSRHQRGMRQASFQHGYGNQRGQPPPYPQPQEPYWGQAQAQSHVRSPCMSCRTLAFNTRSQGILHT